MEFCQISELQRSYSSKVICGALLDDWANSGYDDGLLQGW